MSNIKEYFDSKRVSNSLLGTINNPRYIWLREQGLIEDFDRPYFRIGSGIDCLLTDPDRWDEEFAISEGNKPSGLLGKFVEALPRYINSKDDISVYEDAYRVAGYKANIENVIRWFWENESAVKYYKDRFLVESGKELLGREEFEAIKYAVEVIKENEFTSFYFIPSEDEGNIERLFQQAIYFQVREVECKGLLDGILINHDEKTIQPIDLKSTGKKVQEFPTSFTQFGYQRQAAFYLLALNSFLQNRSEYDTRDILNYTILPFKFIVVESKPSHSSALIFQCSENDIHCGLYGGWNKITQQYHKGIYNLLEDYRWHKEHNKWLMPREAYQNKGVLQLDVFLENQI